MCSEEMAPFARPYKRSAPLARPEIHGPHLHGLTPCPARFDTISSEPGYNPSCFATSIVRPGLPGAATVMLCPALVILTSVSSVGL